MPHAGAELPAHLLVEPVGWRPFFVRDDHDDDWSIVDSDAELMTFAVQKLTADGYVAAVFDAAAGILTVADVGQSFPCRARKCVLVVSEEHRWEYEMKR